jgi:hypothetical protein
MSVLTAPPPKTSANRIFLFFLLGATSTIPFLVLSFVLTAYWALFLTPLLVLVLLIFMFAREKRVSEAKPRWLELFLSTLGAFYPSVLIAIVLWLIRWALYGLTFLVGVDGEYKGDAYNFANVVFVLLLLGSIVFLVSMNWRHLVNQLYPKVGNQSAFAQISATGKKWLIKRGSFLSFIFIILIPVVFFTLASNMSDNGALNIRNEFLMGLFVIVFYMFFISISAWLWLREPEIPRGVEVTNKTIVRLLQPLGYEVQTLAKIKNKPELGVDISDRMTASIDLISQSEGDSLIIDVMTSEETLASPDLAIASEFRMATWYLQGILQLSKPVKVVFVLVDVEADDTFFTFTDDHNIQVLQLSGEEVVDLLTQDMDEQALLETAAGLFSFSLNNFSTTSSFAKPVMENGGQDV